jgi:mannose-6-phosphate isomerase-like protein (cupin superfamily)
MAGVGSREPGIGELRDQLEEIAREHADAIALGDHARADELADRSRTLSGQLARAKRSHYAELSPRSWRHEPPESLAHKAARLRQQARDLQWRGKGAEAQLLQAEAAHLESGKVARARRVHVGDVLTIGPSPRAGTAMVLTDEGWAVVALDGAGRVQKILLDAASYKAAKAVYEAERSMAVASSKDLAAMALRNDDYRKVVQTTPTRQLALMSIPAGQDIGEESHAQRQTIVVVAGSGRAHVGSRRQDVGPGSMVVVPSGQSHNIVSTGLGALKLYTIYEPPAHPEGQVQRQRP